MNLVIQVENGEPINHPILLENLLQAFPDLDPNNLPPKYVRFERIPMPNMGPYIKGYECRYELVDGIYKDVWYADEMSAQEKLDLQEAVKTTWAENFNFASWTFNEETCRYDPPVPYPTDGANYTWDEATLSWIPVTE